ncbi:IclR family transcriptional regulator [Tianweitania sediminis]|uniref:IclR family transcriptional regulator n=1 Tax=Tianweitania sediminis TaxID=1502156 RepID=A0A8J7R177_9HYPH|nr:IclR family transcriptional regulator [Tianweitania sediminis]MBP0438331.1 IclR family transcriptional regulator [Tianweitania sediminis]
MAQAAGGRTLKRGEPVSKISQVEDKGAATHNVRAVSRALRVLKSFAGKSGQTLAEVTVATGLDKGTTRRLLLTLMDNGFIMQDAQTQQYRLGFAIRELAADVTGDFDLRALALPILNELAAELHITAFLSVYDNNDAVCLERIHDMRGIEVHWWAVGGVLQFNCGGAPKLLLAFRPDNEIDEVLKRPMAALTSKSIVEPEKLRAELMRIRKRGWELAVDDVALGLSAIAVPVRDTAGEIVCALSIAGLTPQLVNRGKPVHLERMQRAAGELERRLRAGH